jgi:hypothetical protein
MFAGVGVFAYQAAREPLHVFVNGNFSVARVLLIALYVGLSAAAALVNVQIPYTEVHFSMDTAFVFAVLMIFGPLEAMVADAAAKVANTWWAVPDRRANWYKIPFNVSSGWLSVFAAGFVYRALLPEHAGYTQFLAPLVAMTLAYFLVNSWTVALAIALSLRANLAKLWAENFLWTGIGFFAALSIAILIFLMDSAIDGLSFLVSAPILALIYFSERVYLKQAAEFKGRIEDLQQRLQDLDDSRNDLAGAVALAESQVRQAAYPVDQVLDNLALYVALAAGNAREIERRDTLDWADFVRAAANGAAPPDGSLAVSIAAPPEPGAAHLPFAAIEVVVRNVIRLAEISSATRLWIDLTPATTAAAEPSTALAFHWIGERGVDNLDRLDAPFKMLAFYCCDELPAGARANLEQLLYLGISKKASDLCRGSLTCRVEPADGAGFAYDIRLAFGAGWGLNG